MEQKKEYFTEDADRMFKEALGIIVLSWPVIKLVRQNRWVSRINKKVSNDPEAKQFNVDSEFKKTEKEIINEFIDDLFNYVTKFDCKQDELELWLMREVEYRFYTIIEDNSERELAKGILDLFLELDDKKFTMYEEIKKMGVMMKDIKVDGQCGNEEDDDSDDDSQAEWEDSSQVGPDDIVMTEEELLQLKKEQEEKKAEMESDGFTVVDKKKKK